MSLRVLVLSAHVVLDRRIIAEMNTLAEAGYQVTLLTVPADIPKSAIDPRVGVIGAATMAPRPTLRSTVKWTSKWLVKTLLPRRTFEAIRQFRHRRRLARFARDPHLPMRWMRGHTASLSGYFVAHAPAGLFDIIHCHDLETLPGAVQVRDAKGPSAKIVYDSHELFPYQNDDPMAQRYWSEVEREHIKQADLIITVNASIARLMTEYYGVPEPSVIYNSYSLLTEATSVTEAEFLKLFGVGPDGFKILFQGSLSEYRNLPNLVRAFKLLDESYRLFVIGTGPYEAEMRSIISELRLKNVHMGGWVDQEKLMAYTRHADLGVIPYFAKPGVLNMLYCTPNKLFEFMHARIPICGSDLPEIAAILRECGNGTAYGLNSPEDIAASLKDARARVERGEYTPEKMAHAAERYSWPVQAERLLELYSRFKAVAPNEN